MTGHHSEASARNAQRKMWAAEERGHAEADKSQYWAARADAAGRTRGFRESVPVTLRRIAKLEAEERSVRRTLDASASRTGGNPAEAAAGEHREYLLVRLRDIGEELTHWRQHVAARQADGVKVWTRDDFAKGDFVRFGGHATWYEVIRVNPKSVTVPAMIAGPGRAVLRAADNPYSWTDTIPYDKVTGRKPGYEMTAILADTLHETTGQA